MSYTPWFMVHVRRQAIYVQRNIQERLSIQHARHMRHIVIRALYGYTKFFCIVPNTEFFLKKLLNIECAFSFSLQLLSK
jgi:hypothetical protein